MASPTQLVGEPTMTLDYSGNAPNPDARVYAQIVDTKANRVVGPVVVPVALTLDGAEHVLSMPIEGIALTATPADSYELQITDGSSVYFAQREAGVVNFKRIGLSIPTVAAATASSDSSKDRFRSMPYIVRCLSVHLSPMPVSIRMRSPCPSMNRQFMFMRMRFCSSGGQAFDQRLRGTTPNIAPPSRRNSQSETTSTR